MRRIAFSLLVIICMISMIHPTQAKDTDIKVLIITHFEDDIQAEQGHILDLLVGHFTKDITIQSMDEVAKDKTLVINDFTHVFYLGLSREEIPDLARDVIDDYRGPIFYIGNHLEHFQNASFLTFNTYEKITNVVEGDKEVELTVAETVIDYNFQENIGVRYEGKLEGNQYPLIFTHKEDYYMATESITGRLGNYLGESLFDFFHIERGIPKKYLRLEDVHPRSDPEKLKEIADYLKKEQIPYMITVIPVYTNPETDETVHFSDEYKLVNVLRYMQDHGASIVLHGYKHQYRDTETGEGFEYWDVENERPIYQEKDEEVFFRKDFKTDQAYETYLENGLLFEQSYIERTVTQGVKELVEQGLYPLAFEAPHYSMSLSGYKELSNYFSTYIGQTQISNETHKTSYTPLYASEPLLLHGMKVLPETLGYVDPNNEQAVQDIINKATSISHFSDSYLAFFYHPYLGIDQLKKVIQGLKEYDTYEWIDLKQMDNKVVVEDITIVSKDGEITVDRPLHTQLIPILKNIWWFIFPLSFFIFIIVYANKKRTRA